MHTVSKCSWKEEARRKLPQREGPSPKQRAGGAAGRGWAARPRRCGAGQGTRVEHARRRPGQRAVRLRDQLVALVQARAAARYSKRPLALQDPPGVQSRVLRVQADVRL